jgi:hypothetical protein
MTDEKFDEKYDEKEMEKRDEKSAEEKNWDEKWRRDPLGAMVWASILIWAGVVFLLGNLGFLDSILSRGREITDWGLFDRLAESWAIVMIGAGVILLIEVLVRLLVPIYRRPVTGTIILAAIFIGVGLGDLIDWSIIWAVVLIVIGVSILARGLTRSRDE